MEISVKLSSVAVKLPRRPKYGKGNPREKKPISPTLTETERNNIKEALSLRIRELLAQINKDPKNELLREQLKTALDEKVAFVIKYFPDEWDRFKDIVEFPDERKCFNNIFKFPVKKRRT